MSLRVKICGLCNAKDVEFVLSCQPDAVGFVFWPRSPRAVTPEQVREWTAEWPNGILRVGVFVDSTLEEIIRAVEIARLDVVQLHASVSIQPYRACGRPIWQAKRLGVPDAETAVELPDAFVVDSYTRELPGGTGQPVDWVSAAEFVRGSPKPVMLAGGLTPDNVELAVRLVRPWGVDVSSGVERSPGRKDPARVRQFVQICRSIDQLA